VVGSTAEATNWLLGKERVEAAACSVLPLQGLSIGTRPEVWGLFTDVVEVVFSEVGHEKTPPGIMFATATVRGFLVSAEDNKAVVRRWIEAYNNRDTQAEADAHAPG
jgi:hypothetical protein